MNSSDAIDPEQSANRDETTVDLRSSYKASGIQEILDLLDLELIGLKPVKARIREIAALLVVNKARHLVGL